MDTRGLHDDLDWAAGEGEDLEEWECVACRKMFRSEAAWDSHERSKKHLKEVERLKREMQADHQDLDLNGENEDEVICANNQSLATNSSSSINLAAEALPSLPSLVSQSTKDLDNPVQVLNVGEEKGLKAAEISGKRSRATAGRQILDFPISTSETDITKASNVDGIHLVSPAEPPITQEMSKRDKRRARQAKKAELEDNNNSTVWMIALFAIRLSDQHLLATLQLLRPGLCKQNPIIQPHLSDWALSCP